VKITTGDIDRFYEMTSGSRLQFPVVDGEVGLSERARAEISSVRSKFTPQQLAAGAAILRAASRACRMKEQRTEIIFYRDSLYAWIAYVAQQEL
jgi:hypothetical protein